MQPDKPGIVPLIAAESNGDLVAPAAQDESPHQDWLIGKDEGVSATRVLHCHLLSLQHAHIQHLWKGEMMPNPQRNNRNMIRLGSVPLF